MYDACEVTKKFMIQQTSQRDAITAIWTSMSKEKGFSGMYLINCFNYI